MTNMTIADAAWLAGIIDGEGSIFIMRQPRKDRERKFNFIMRVSVQSTDPYMTVACKRVTNDGCVLAAHLDKRPNNSHTLKWQVNGKKAARILETILPYMKVKGTQAEIALDFQKTTKKHWKNMEALDYEKQERLWTAMKAAKQSLKLGRDTVRLEAIRKAA